MGRIELPTSIKVRIVGTAMIIDIPVRVSAYLHIHTPCTGFAPDRAFVNQRLTQWIAVDSNHEPSLRSSLETRYQLR